MVSFVDFGGSPEVVLSLWIPLMAGNDQPQVVTWLMNSQQQLGLHDLGPALRTGTKSEKPSIVSHSGRVPQLFLPSLSRSQSELVRGIGCVAGKPLMSPSLLMAGHRDGVPRP